MNTDREAHQDAHTDLDRVSEPVILPDVVDSNPIDRSVATSAVDVRHDPDDPAEPVFDARVSFRWLCAALAIVFLALPLFLSGARR